MLNNNANAISAIYKNESSSTNNEQQQVIFINSIFLLGYFENFSKKIIGQIPSRFFILNSFFSSQEIKKPILYTHRSGKKVWNFAK